MPAQSPSSVPGPVPDDLSHPAPTPARGHEPAPKGERMDVLGGLTVFLAVTAGVAMAAMLITKWVVGGGEIWPWFTRYALVALPLSVVLLFVLLVRNAIRRART
ncbi:hypothetical protein [Kocuria palustris]|uniref:hypothetical protein n=1 Tax=Kocuria palustris TaxID=71999 RepID=UPI0011A5FCAE|nr:hypothetical protein [Kocuria palustris]